MTKLPEGSWRQMKQLSWFSDMPPISVRNDKRTCVQMENPGGTET